MRMTIEELITFCEEKEYNHRLNCKRYDDASGYTRSKDKNIRTACAIREDTYADFYKEISDTIRKYRQIQPKTAHWIVTIGDWLKWECSYCGYTKSTDVHVRLGYSYCPRCGANMESEDKE